MVAQTPAPERGFDARGGLSTGGWAGDPQLSVSSSHVAVTCRGVLNFYTRAGLPLMSTALGLDKFFAPLNLASEGYVGYFDARTIFDRYRRRFLIGALAFKAGPTAHRFVLAVSKGEDPRQGFFMYQWPASPPQLNLPSYQADYPSISVDRKAVYQTNLVQRQDGSRFWAVTLFDAVAMAQGINPGGWRFWDLRNPDGSQVGVVQPAMQHDAVDRNFLVSRWGTDRVVVWAIDVPTPISLGPRLQRVAVTLAPFQSPVDGPQQGSATHKIRMTNLGTEVLKAVVRRGLLHFATNDARPWGGTESLSSIRLVRMSVTNFPSIPRERESGFIDRPFGGSSSIDDPAGSRMYYAWPALEVNKFGHIVIVYTRTGSTIFPQVRVSAYLANESDISPSRRAKAGEATYTAKPTSVTSMPWGDVGGACVDPVDDTGVWFCHQYTIPTSLAPPNDSNYSIWVGKLFGVSSP